MDTVRQWAAAVCFAAMAGGLCLFLIPNSTMSKVVHLTVSVFFLCALILPITDMDLEAGWNNLENEQEKLNEIAAQMTEQSELSAYQIAEANINKIVRNALDDMGIKTIACTINIIAEEKDIPAVEARLMIPQIYQSRKAEIESRIKDLSIETVLIDFTDE